MNLLGLIESQLLSNRLPLVAVTLAAVPHTNTPTVLTLHWHGFVEVRLTQDSETVAYQSVPSSALQVNERWDRFDDLDHAAMETAWELGAWNLERIEAQPFFRPGAASHETVTGMHAFGASPIAIDGDSPILAEVPDSDDLIHAASREGYVHWLFRAVRGGLWAETADDVTLEAGGYRNPTCPLLSQPVAAAAFRATARKVIYTFGRSRRSLVSGDK
ncbi:MAG: hypothetical protein LH481_00300 [Burkholderiales bacterium]|nr:hypothetical protein [Burkholderiales bacterium]